MASDAKQCINCRGELQEIFVTYTLRTESSTPSDRTVKSVKDYPPKGQEYKPVWSNRYACKKCDLIQEFIKWED